MNWGAFTPPLPLGSAKDTFRLDFRMVWSRMLTTFCATTGSVKVTKPNPLQEKENILIKVHHQVKNRSEADLKAHQPTKIASKAQLIHPTYTAQLANLQHVILGIQKCTHSKPANAPFTRKILYQQISALFQSKLTLDWPLITPFSSKLTLYQQMYSSLAYSPLTGQQIHPLPANAPFTSKCTIYHLYQQIHPLPANSPFTSKFTHYQQTLEWSANSPFTSNS